MHESVVVGWDNFYVMVGSSAAALIGLTFVVIALAADANRVRRRGLRAFVTPSIVHFGSVLALAAFLSVPRQTVPSLGAGLGIAGFVGLANSITTLVNMRRFADTYVPVREDWVWHVMLPAVAYLTLLAMAILVWAFAHADGALYGVAAAALALLFIGIHNAWDVAVSISTRDTPESH